MVVAMALALMCANAQGTYTPEQVPDVHRQDARRYVSDPANILSSSTVSRLNSMASALETATGVETAIVVVPSIGNASPEDFTVRLFEMWSIGKKGDDNGLLVLLATEDRLLRFEVGYGLEGVLTDAMSKRIQTQRMNPYLSQGDWDDGLIAGLTAIEELLTDPDSELLAQQDSPAGEGFAAALLVIFGLLVFIMVIAWLGYRRGRKCPRCGHQMQDVSQSSRMVSPGVKMISTVMRCPNCGYTTTKNRTENVGGAVIGGTIGGLGGLGGLGRGGGGFTGGWGGGRSGGGGATSRF